MRGAAGLATSLCLAVWLIGAAGCAADQEVVTCTRSETRLESGVRVLDLECGSGKEAMRGHSLTVEYVARADGRTFDSTRERGEPLTFRLGVGQVLQGLDEGLLGMQQGGVRRVTIPPEFAYGEAGFPPQVPPDTTVVFEVELLSMREPPE
ncbi:MAG: FKBP-type peptidyl-prolyl cis-trans isomerase [Actinomycetota bacterium]|nr:FKBP-type peptidyl-prolyl cis-trans isomerase [Actinomycetota bacterium]